MYDDILQIGNKVDVVSVALIERKKNGEGKAPVMVSQIDDIRDDGTIIISMPMVKGKIVLINSGIRYEFLFYSKKGLYRAVGQVTGRYKEGNFAFAKIVLTTNLVKFQRREYFRLQCALPMKAYIIKESEETTSPTFDVTTYVDIPEIAETAVSGIMVDISGGGMRFTSPVIFDNGCEIAVRTLLTNGETKWDLILSMYVINSRRTANNSDVYETRGEFVNLNPKLRERIIKYIFDEDRRVRKKG